MVREREFYRESDRGIHFRGEARVLLVLEEERILEAESLGMPIMDFIVFLLRFC